MIARTLQATSGKLKLAWFLVSGKRPFSTGYGAYKEEHVRGVLDRGEFHPGKLPDGYGVDLDERIIEYPWLLSHLPSGPGLLLDAGSALNFRFLLDLPALAAKTVHICTWHPSDRASGSWESPTPFRISGVPVTGTPSSITW